MEEVCPVTLAEGLTIPQQSIGVAAVSRGFSGFDGILGYAYYFADDIDADFPGTALGLWASLRVKYRLLPVTSCNHHLLNCMLLRGNRIAGSRPIGYGADCD